MKEKKETPPPTPQKGISAETHPEHRPCSLDEFVGQEPLKERLKIAIEACRKTGRTMSHVLMSSPRTGGVGKTSIALLIARELGREAKILNAASLQKTSDIMQVVAKVQTGDVLILDESHNLSKKVQEVLYPVLEDFRVEIKAGAAQNKIRSIQVARFTMIGATTHIGKLQRPFIDRFGIYHNIDLYSPTEVAEIIRRTTKRWAIRTPDDSVLLDLGGRARGIPRVGLRLFERCRDFADAKNGGTISRQTVEEAMGLEGIDARGLNKQDHRYLRLLADDYDGSPVGLNAIASNLQEDPSTVSETIEPYLISLGLVLRTGKGRRITDEGLKVLTGV
jgi:Holliday junction DNA helicase RuvB